MDKGSTMATAITTDGEDEEETARTVTIAGTLHTSQHDEGADRHVYQRRRSLWVGYVVEIWPYW
jgi:hypothetical protein